MKLAKVESSQISHIGHDPDANQMIVKFTRGASLYHYKNVTADHHAALVGAESIGSHFIHNIKSNPSAFPYSKYDAAVHGPVEIEGE